MMDGKQNLPLPFPVTLGTMELWMPNRAPINLS